MLLDKSTDYGFYQHPQLWLIPVALSVLVAGHVNRDQLTKDQMTMIRYATLMMIYVSSTSDIFINGVSESPLADDIAGAIRDWRARGDGDANSRIPLPGYVVPAAVVGSVNLDGV